MFDCEEYQNALGEKKVRINTTAKDWNRLLKTGLWDKIMKVLDDTKEPPK